MEITQQKQIDTTGNSSLEVRYNDQGVEIDLSRYSAGAVHEIFRDVREALVRRYEDGTVRPSFHDNGEGNVRISIPLMEKQKEVFDDICAIIAEDVNRVIAKRAMRELDKNRKSGIGIP